MAYYEICSDLLDGGWTSSSDPIGSPYAVKGDQWVGYDTADSIGVKMDYIRSRRLGGAMIWAIDLDDFQGVCGTKYPLLDAINVGLGRASLSPGGVSSTSKPVTSAKPSTTSTTSPAVTVTNQPVVSTTSATPSTSSVVPTTTSASPWTQPACGLESDNYYANSDDCTRFHRCAGGQIYDFVCPSGLFFDATVQVCNWPFFVQCNSPPGSPTFYTFLTDYDQSNK